MCVCHMRKAMNFAFVGHDRMTKQLFRIFKFITHTRICAPFPFNKSLNWKWFRDFVRSKTLSLMQQKKPSTDDFYNTTIDVYMSRLKSAIFFTKHSTVLLSLLVHVKALSFSSFLSSQHSTSCFLLGTPGTICLWECWLWKNGTPVRSFKITGNHEMCNCIATIKLFHMRKNHNMKILARSRCPKSIHIWIEIWVFASPISKQCPHISNSDCCAH